MNTIVKLIILLTLSTIFINTAQASYHELTYIPQNPSEQNSFSCYELNMFAITNYLYPEGTVLYCGVPNRLEIINKKHNNKNRQNSESSIIINTPNNDDDNEEHKETEDKKKSKKHDHPEHPDKSNKPDKKDNKLSTFFHNFYIL